MADQNKKVEEAEQMAASRSENGDELELKDLSQELSEQDMEQVAGGRSKRGRL